MNREEPPAHARRVLNELHGVRPTRDGWVALCPCPDHGTDGDQKPSLHVSLGGDGRVLLKCRVGCLTDAVLEAVGLEWRELYADDDAAGDDDGIATSVSPDGTIEGRDAGVTTAARPAKADVEVCDNAYRLLLDQLSLSEDHRRDLRARGLPDDEIDRRGYRSLRNVDRGRAARAVHGALGDAVLAVPGFTGVGSGVTLDGEAAGLLVPVRDLQGRIRAIKIRRASTPKYLYLSGAKDGLSPGSPVHVPLGVTGPASVVRVTEGELKADLAQTLDPHTPTIGVPGVTQWRAAVPVLRELRASTVVIAFDAPDVHTKVPVFEQAEAFWHALAEEGFEVEVEDWNDDV